MCLDTLTLFILIEFPKHIDTKYVWDTQFCALRGHRLTFLKNNVGMSLKIVFILANSADPDEMPPSEAVWP